MFYLLQPAVGHMEVRVWSEAHAPVEEVAEAAEASLVVHEVFWVGGLHAPVDGGKESTKIKCITKTALTFSYFNNWSFFSWHFPVVLPGIPSAWLVGQSQSSWEEQNGIEFINRLVPCIINICTVYFDHYYTYCIISIIITSFVLLLQEKIMSYHRYKWSIWHNSWIFPCQN